LACALPLRHECLQYSCGPANLCSPDLSRKIREAVTHSKIKAFVSEASLFIECLSFEAKLAYLDVAFTRRERELPDPRRIAIFEELGRLGCTMLHAPLLGAEIFIEGLPWAADEVFSQEKRRDRFANFTRQYPRHDPLKALGEAKLRQQRVPPGSNLSIPSGTYMTGPGQWKHAFKREWDAGNKQIRKNLRTDVEPLIGEWCDQLIVGSHFAYGNDYFCTTDLGRGAGASSLLHHSNRSALANQGINIIDPNDLSDKASWIG
jgi:hypothetical protein